MTDSQRYFSQVEAAALSGLTREQSAAAQAYVQRIVQDWLQQAGEDPTLQREALVEIGLADLEASLAGKAGEARVAALHFLALKPQVQQTSARAFTLATQVADEKTPRQQAAPEAAGLMERLHQLMREARQLTDADDRRLLLRDLADADLEARYVIEDEEGAISIRLNRYING